jgi:DNA-binding NtrC family response regulator
MLPWASFRDRPSFHCAPALGVRAWLPAVSRPASLTSPARSAILAAIGVRGSMSVPLRVLLAEDEPTSALAVRRFLESRGHEVTVCETGEAAMRALAEAEWDVLLLDLKLPDAEGVDILEKVRKEHGELQTIIVTGHADVESAIHTMRLGAFDYLTKPPKFEELAVRVEKAAEKTLLEREAGRLRYHVQRGLASPILTRSDALRRVIDTIERLAPARTPVLIQGESGVGKELIAQHLHRLSPRAQRAFVDLNCAAVASTLLETELFGHEKGAFTGATAEKPGLVEVADGGTLFLDEVAEMAPEVQAKLLRVLDSGTFYRVGAARKRRVDFRLVAATNRDLDAEVDAGRFRRDLFYRIHGVRVHVPPLRQRPEDVPLLVEHFSRMLPVSRRFAPEALHALQAYSWPGNVRELRFTVERAGLLAEGPIIGVGDLPPEIVARQSRPVLPPPPETAHPEPAAPARGPDPQRVRQALERARWRRGEAAKILGVSPRTLFRWMKQLGL